MPSYHDAKEIQHLSLGKATSYSSQYDPTLLQAVPRSLNRNDLAMDQANLPFFGEDVWYGYELSWLNAKGKPQVAVAEFRFPCTSTNIVESKSFKLYLNSFNQTKFDNWHKVQDALIKDLSACATADCSVSLYPVDQCPPLNIVASNATCIDELDIEVNVYDYQPALLQGAASDEPADEQLVSHLLKSNCLITNQPDWASLYIHYRGGKINHQALLKYIIAFREHNEFHEQCVERIYTDIINYCAPEQLTVYARYTRRGGLDINPFRSSIKQKAPEQRTYRQ